MTESLLDTSLKVWKHILDSEQIKDSLFENINIDNPEVGLDTINFAPLLHYYAESVGINTKDFGEKLIGEIKSENVLKFQTAIALRTLFEVEGHFVEIPNACTIYKIPSRFLIVFGAIVIGIATGKISQLDPIIAGAFSGVGNLLINILAARYVSENSKNSVITWTEEFLLIFLEKNGEQSIQEIRKRTRLYKQTIKETLKSLENKGLVESRKITLEGKKVKTELIFSITPKP